MYCGMLLSLAKLIYPSVRLQDQTFELHMICGVNDCVSGPVGSCHIFYHSHVNFVASTEFPRGSASSVLFFAEISTDGNDKSFCCPVSLPPPCAGMLYNQPMLIFFPNLITAIYSTVN